MSGTLEDAHAHLLTKTNIQMCRDCGRFFIITYEKNERGEAVETGYELDIKATKSGVVTPQDADWVPPHTSESYHPSKRNDRRELTCF
ncbi:hypothetical protein J2P12_04460 [Candidatus Bathyarchaeota archaeon]|nr:hypothetical protein [Candidatus Bathyarchaeota archaeon]